MSYFYRAGRLEMLVKTSGMCLFGVRPRLVFSNPLVAFLYGVSGPHVK